MPHSDQVVDMASLWEQTQWEDKVKHQADLDMRRTDCAEFVVDLLWKVRNDFPQQPISMKEKEMGRIIAKVNDYFQSAIAAENKLSSAKSQPA